MADAIATGSKKVGEDEEISAELAPELERRIWVHLPISSCVKFASVCKDWYSTISSPSFSAEISLLTPGKHPFLFLTGFHPSSPYSLSCAYDPIACRWFRLNANMPYPPIASQYYGLISGTRGPLVFYSIGLSSPFSYNLHYALNPTCIQWQPISPFSPSLCRFPVVRVFDSGHTSMSPAFNVFVLSDATTVLLYDSATNSWVHCESLPSGGFFGPIGSFNISTAVLGRKIYIAGISSGTITSFDVDTRTWSRLSDLRILNAMYLLITSSNKGLFALGICYAQVGKCLKLFKVNELTMKCKEVSRMPEHLWSLFGDQPEQHVTRLKCVGSGNLVYVYYGSFFNDIRVCVCDLEGYIWQRLPALPSRLRECNVKAECCSIQLLPMDCLKSQYN